MFLENLMNKKREIIAKLRELRDEDNDEVYELEEELEEVNESIAYYMAV